jgi:hypothetical protein
MMRAHSFSDWIISVSSRRLLIPLLASFALLSLAAPGPVPLPEHPRPDFERADWANLNGAWRFRFDPDDAGLTGKWWQDPVAFPDTLQDGSGHRSRAED